jgi:hypothetical protein
MERRDFVPSVPGAPGPSSMNEHADAVRRALISHINADG